MTLLFSGKTARPQCTRRSFYPGSSRRGALFSGATAVVLVEKSIGQRGALALRRRLGVKHLDESIGQRRTLVVQPALHGGDLGAEIGVRLRQLVLVVAVLLD